MSHQKLMALEARIDQLLREHERLHRLVVSHEKERQQWQAERDAMHQRHEQARQRLDYVIARLKEFEGAS